MSGRHPSRRRSVVSLVLLLVVVLSMAAVVIANRQSPDPNPSPTSSPAPEPLGAEPTLLVQVRDDGFTNVGNVLIGLGETSGGQLFLPASLAVAVDAGRQETLGATGAAPITDAPQIVELQTGVRTDGVFVLDRLAFAGLVDAVGGVTIDVPQTTAFVDRAGTTLAVIPAGQQSLDGPEAALYATFRGAELNAATQYIRFQRVWSALVPLLPDAEERMRAILGSLGASARSTQAAAPLSQFLVRAGVTARGGALLSEELAVRDGAIGPLAISWVAAGQASDQVVRLLPDAVVDSTVQPVRVRLYAAGASLVDVGLLAAQTDTQVAYAWSGPFFTLPTTQVVVADERFAATGRRVAAAAGLVPAVVRIDPAATPGAPVSVFYIGPQAVDLPEAAAAGVDVSSS